MDILLKGGVVMLGASLILAWLATFARWFVIARLAGAIKNSDLIVKGHIDYILMSLFCFAFYAIKIPLPLAACWLIVVGGVTNPAIFVLAALVPDVWTHLWMRVYTALSFMVTTIGFVWAGWTLATAV